MALGLAIAGLTAVFSGGMLLVTQGAAVSTPSSADPAVEYTEWVNEGDPVLTHENVPPGSTTDTERWMPVGEPSKHVTTVAVPQSYGEWSAWSATDLTPPPPRNTDTHEYRVVGNGDAVSEVWANWSPNDTKGPQDYTPIWPTDPRGTWQVHDKIPGGHQGPDGVYNQSNGDSGNSSWFYRRAGKDETCRVEERTRTFIPAVAEVSHLDCMWQKQVRTVVTPPVVAPSVVEPPEVAPAEVPTRCPEPWPWTSEVEPTTGPQANEQEVPEVLGEQAFAPAQQNQAPTVVDAGYAGQPSSDTWATALLVGGVLLLTSAGAVAAARRS